MVLDSTTGYGAVVHNYRIGTTEVTNTQYAAFLNAKAASDPLALYNTSMGSGIGGITRSGSDGSYTYATIDGRQDMPVVYVSWYDAIRFVNWLHNNQGAGDTEDGAYTLSGGTPTPSNGPSIARNLGALWFLPSEDEWYKAAYHKNDGTTGNYFDYPTASDTAPIGEPPAGGSNSANTILAVNDLTNAGAYASSESPYGTFDQGGNVFEWNEALIDDLSRGIRGSSHNTQSLYAHASWRLSNSPTGEGTNLGFRVAMVPEPGTGALAIIAFSLCAIWRRQSRRTDQRIT